MSYDNLIPTEDFVQSLNRIVIGDVGSGKTVVAFFIGLGFLHGITEGIVALLSPTEILAQQHYTNLMNLKLKAGNHLTCDVIFQTSKTRMINGNEFTKQKFESHVQEISQSPFKQFWIGTHSLLERKSFNPDMVMVDEQHRFGVRQRQSLTKSDKSKTIQNLVKPHYISFTATPIPRTLALTVFKSLQPHFLTRFERKSKIKTVISTFEDLETTIMPIMRETIGRGEKIFVICSRIEESEDNEEIWSLEKALKFFKHHFSEREILTVHGKQKEKTDILSRFKHDKTILILISTTVIEVGVDVPEATVMIVLNAEQFGLAALHQIRGRIGRNNLEKNTCLLVTTEPGKFNKRLHYITQSNDGFELAEKDLQLRGHGDLFGQKQSGYESEINDLFGLPPHIYEQIAQEVERLDFETLPKKLPRLWAYIEKESKTVWTE